MMTLTLTAGAGTSWVGRFPAPAHLIWWDLTHYDFAARNPGKRKKFFFGFCGEPFKDVENLIQKMIIKLE